MMGNMCQLYWTNTYTDGWSKISRNFCEGVSKRDYHFESGDLIKMIALSKEGGHHPYC